MRSAPGFQVVTQAPEIGAEDRVFARIFHDQPQGFLAGAQGCFGAFAIRDVVGNGEHGVNVAFAIAQRSSVSDEVAPVIVMFEVKGLAGQRALVVGHVDLRLAGGKDIGDSAALQPVGFKPQIAQCLARRDDVAQLAINDKGGAARQIGRERPVERFALELRCFRLLSSA